MRFSPLVERIGGEGAEAWQVHSAAVAARRRNEDVIVMSVGDPDFDTPEPAITAAIEALRAGDTHYTGTAGRAELRALIAESHKKRSGVATSADNVIVLAGAQCALYATVQCIASPGDEVIVLDPAYVTYEATIRASGADIVRAMPLPGGDFRPDPKAIAAAITDKTRAIFFATPNNPTGVIYTREELSAIAELASRHDLWVVADEVYADLVFDGEHLCISGLADMAQRTVTVSSVSKSHAMTGWRCGWVVAPQPMTVHLSRLALCMLYGSPGFVQTAAATALRDCAADVARMAGIYRHRRDLVVDLLRQGLGAAACKSPQAGMFALLDIRASGMTGSEFSRALFEDCGVSVLDASAFGASAEGFARISFVLDDAELTEGCRRIVRFIKQRMSGNNPP